MNKTISQYALCSAHDLIVILVAVLFAIIMLIWSPRAVAAEFSKLSVEQTAMAERALTFLDEMEAMYFGAVAKLNGTDKIESVDINDEFAARNVKVALEPYNRDDANLLNTVEDATEFIAGVDRTHAQLMADFFHMKLNDESFDTLEAAAPHLIHAHIAEPSRGRPETTPEQHAQFLQALRLYGYDGRVTLSGTLTAYANDGETCTALKKAIA